MYKGCKSIALRRLLDDAAAAAAGEGHAAALEPISSDLPGIDCPRVSSSPQVQVVAVDGWWRTWAVEAVEDEVDGSRTVPLVALVTLLY